MRASCSWNRETITFTNSQQFAGVKINEDAKEFAPLDPGSTGATDIPIELDARAIQQARLAGDHICIRISGGASSKPDIISSENAATPPTIELMIAKPVAESTVGESNVGESAKAEASAASTTLALKTAKAQIQASVQAELLADNAKHLKTLDEKAEVACKIQVTEATTGSARVVIANQINLINDQEYDNKLIQKRKEIEIQAAGTDSTQALNTATLALKGEYETKKKDAITAKLQEAKETVETNCENEKKERTAKWSNLTSKQHKEMKDVVEEKFMKQSVQNAVNQNIDRRDSQQGKIVPKPVEATLKVTTMEGDALLAL